MLLQCWVVPAVKLALFGAENQQGMAFEYCAPLGPTSRVSSASPSKEGLPSRGGGRDLGIHTAAAAGTTDSTVTWCSANGAEPGSPGPDKAKGCLTLYRVSHSTGPKGLALVKTPSLCRAASCAFVTRTPVWCSVMVQTDIQTRPGLLLLCCPSS